MYGSSMSNKAYTCSSISNKLCCPKLISVFFFSDKPEGSPITTEPVNNNEEFGVVVRTRLESHSLGKL